MTLKDCLGFAHMLDALGGQEVQGRSEDELDLLMKLYLIEEDEDASKNSERLDD